MEETVNEARKQAGEDETEKKLDQLREVCHMVEFTKTLYQVYVCMLTLSL